MYFLAKILLFSTANPLFFRISATVTTVAIAVNDKRRKFNRNHAKAKKISIQQMRLDGMIT